MAGVRVEATRADYAANELIFASGAFTGRTIPATGSTDYVDVLPGVHVNFFPTPASSPSAPRGPTRSAGPPTRTWRRSASSTKCRKPTAPSSAACLRGQLRARSRTESMNLDLSFEYLPAVRPALGRAVLQAHRQPHLRSQHSPRRTSSTTAAPMRGSGCHARRTPNAATSAASSSTTRRSSAGCRRRSMASAPTSITPGRDSSVTLFGRDDELPFFKQSEHIGNAALLYRKYGIEGQLSLSFQGPRSARSARTPTATSTPTGTGRSMRRSASR